MTRDGRKNLEFGYNYLNLVDRVSGDGGRASYMWLADGSKVEVGDGQGNGYRYLGSLVYIRHNGSDWQLEGTGFGGGRILVSRSGGASSDGTSSGSGSGGYGNGSGSNSDGSGAGSGGSNNGSGSGSSSGGFKMEYTTLYTITDHLGSSRVVFTYSRLADGTQTPHVLAQNDYYPFGGRHSNPGLSAGNDTDNRYQFNGKEQQTTGNIGLLDYGWRMYDPVLGRWHGVDLLTEKHFALSPYVYCNNNPILYVDPNGLDWYLHQRRGTLVYYDNGVKIREWEKNDLMKLPFNGKLLSRGLDMKGVKRREFSFEESQLIANEAGYKIAPTQRFVYSYIQTQRVFANPGTSNTFKNGIRIIINERYGWIKAYQALKILNSKYVKHFLPEANFFGLLTTEQAVREFMEAYNPATGLYGEEVMAVIKKYGFEGVFGGIIDYVNEYEFRSWLEYQKSGMLDGKLMYLRKEAEYNNSAVD